MDATAPALRSGGRAPSWSAASPRPRARGQRGPASVGTGDVPAPGAGLRAAALDELLEPLRVRLHLAVVEAQGGAGLLDQALGLPVDLDHDPRLGVVQAVEGDHPGVL